MEKGLGTGHNANNPKYGRRRDQLHKTPQKKLNSESAAAQMSIIN